MILHRILGRYPDILMIQAPTCFLGFERGVCYQVFGVQGFGIRAYRFQGMAFRLKVQGSGFSLTLTNPT